MLACCVLLLCAGTARAGESKLAFAVPGVVAEVMVKAGQAVVAGAPLARLDALPFAARNKATVARRKAAAASLDWAVRNRDRVKELFDDLSTSGEELEKAEDALIKAKALHAEAIAHADIAEWRLRRATLRAPAAGTITLVPGYAGMVVNPLSANPTIAVLQTK